jgi:small-conductance mechanosensitive channel
VATAGPGARTTSRQRNKQTSYLRTSASQYRHLAEEAGSKESTSIKAIEIAQLGNEKFDDDSTDAMESKRMQKDMNPYCEYLDDDDGRGGMSTTEQEQSGREQQPATQINFFQNPISDRSALSPNKSFRQKTLEQQSTSKVNKSRNNPFNRGSYA